MTTPRWTEHHTGAALVAVCAGVASAAAMADIGSARPLVLLVVIATTVGGLLLDGFLGLGLGVVGAAAAVVAVKHAGAWDRTRFEELTLLTLSIVVLAWCAGLLGATLRAQRRALERGRPADVQPALDSLGLLPADVAELRVEEELSRARRHRRPLSVLGVSATPRPGVDVQPAVLHAARRAVARHLERRLRRSDAPFALDDASMGAVLPETSGTGLTTVATTIGSEGRALRVRDRAAGRLVPLSDVVDLRVVVLEADGDDEDARDLLSRLRSRLAEGDAGAAARAAAAAESPVVPR